MKKKQPTVRRKFDDAQKLSIIASVAKMKESGIGVDRACKQLKLAPSAYRRWLKVFGPTTPATEPQKEVPVKNGSDGRRISTPDERNELVDRVKNHVSQDKMTLQDACKKVGIDKASYYSWTKSERAAPGTLRNEAKKRAAVAKIERLLSEGTLIKVACKKVGISDATYYHYKKQLNGIATLGLNPPPGVKVAEIDAALFAPPAVRTPKEKTTRVNGGDRTLSLPGGEGDARLRLAAMFVQTMHEILTR